MKFGYLSINNVYGIKPGLLGKALEDRGFESLWVPEHSHLPIASVGTYPDPSRAMPDGYAHMMSPFISLMAAAAATSNLKLGTGMSVGLEHDLLDLACTTATLDTLSDSRLILGLGVGWNEEEYDNHCHPGPFKKRYSAMEERVAALRAAWSYQAGHEAYSGPYADTDWGKQISSFTGEYDSFSPSWVFPKPAQGGIPIALGFAGPLGTKHAAKYADIWAPVDGTLIHEGKLDVAGRIRYFKDLVTENGRNPDDVKITLFNLGGETEAIIDQYSTLDIERFVFGPATFMQHPEAETLQRLDKIQPLVEKYSS